MKLSPRTIERISDVLHSEIQFYNEYGQPANNAILKDIEAVLTWAFVKKPKKRRAKR